MILSLLSFSGYQSYLSHFIVCEFAWCFSKINQSSPAFTSTSQTFTYKGLLIFRVWRCTAIASNVLSLYFISVIALSIKSIG
jgi:hypothetical protein